MFRLIFPVLFLAPAVSVFGASTGVSSCVPATLTTYAGSYAPPSIGCSIGILDYSNFTYSAISNAPLESNIQITPLSGGFNFTQVDGTPFTATNEIVKFAIYYNIFIDPAPVIVGGNDLLDPPVGNVSVTEYFCNDSVLYPNTTSCFPPTATAYSLTVTTEKPAASFTFANPATQYQTVGIVFTLDGTNGTASFDGLMTNTAVTITPEPASAILAGLFLLVGGYKLRKQRQN